MSRNARAEELELELIKTALRRHANGEGAPASRLLLVAAIYIHLRDAGAGSLRTTVERTLRNAGAA